MVNVGPLAAEIVSLVWGTLANFNGFRVLAALLLSQTAALNRGASCIRQGGHHVGQWPTFKNLKIVAKVKKNFKERKTSLYLWIVAQL